MNPAVIALLLSAPILAVAGGSHAVHGYVTKSGTYVAPHQSTGRGHQRPVCRVAAGGRAAQCRAQAKVSRTLRAAVLAASVICAGAAHAHGGGLDANGCHTDHKTGSYHCHRAQAAPPAPAATPGNKVAAVPARPAVPAGPICHVGPRGGTYTITASGKKNYNGC